VLKKIFGPKGEDVPREWRRLRKDVRHDLYYPTNSVRVTKSRRRWAEYVARMGGEERCIQRFGGKPVTTRLLGRSRHRWEDNI
jgi:hypothetical protein